MFCKKINQKNKELFQENEKLKAENIQLKQQYIDIIFEIKNPPKYQVSDRVKEGLILERRIKNNSWPMIFGNPCFSALFMIELAKTALNYYKNYKDNIESEKNFAKMKEIISEKCWEYRVFNEILKTEKWISENFLNPL